MTVKINDSKMFDAYDEGVASGYDAVESVQSFVENYSPSYAMAIGLQLDRLASTTQFLKLFLI
ncbi:hypothetical protein [Lentilactobacillus buchneri]|uniref:hypothetical protein n=1 Tax=Lentilactobacillus buchneri TaxID=1581 RepID=UPI0012922DB1|nr:hypothetical protein [Lentilactobacillus buchneri]MQM78848.1 hypothetical protein [Lentilactobacillus buchneri]MQM88839.1 hypothetical protein [Lentilactobacillus buchneri]MQN21051.1 hypothetical protein [Lentilactobacillus buchneri]